MAIKESELPTVAVADDADYIRIVTANGESKRVTVEELKDALTQ